MMTQAEIDKLIDELIDARAELTDLEGRYSELQAELKGLEQVYMVSRDEYSEIARALGFNGDTFWGDPLVSHADVLARAKELATLGRVV
jgi:hypothetical protein